MRCKTINLSVFALFIILILALSFSFSLISAPSFGELKVTEEHPFLIDGKWIPASDLKVGDELTTIDGKRVRITAIEDIETKEPFSVYNLEAGKYHDFVVDGGDGLGVIVHNSGKPSWSGSQLFKSARGFKVGTPEYLAEEIPAWAYFDGASELIPDKLNPSVLITRMNSIATYGHYGSARSKIGKWFDEMSGSGQIKNFWFTTIPKKNMHPGYLKTLLHGGTASLDDLGVVEFTLPRGVALKAYGKNTPPHWMNLYKLKTWQYESSYIQAINQEVLLPPGSFKVAPVSISELGTSSRAYLVGGRALGRYVTDLGFKAVVVAPLLAVSGSFLGMSIGEAIYETPGVFIASNSTATIP